VVEENAIGCKGFHNLQTVAGVGDFLQHKSASLQCEPYGHTVLGRVGNHQHIEGRFGDHTRSPPLPVQKRLSREGQHRALVFM
jgi:hypothetical protein